MAVIQTGRAAATDLMTVDPDYKAARTSSYPREGEYYHLAQASGLMTTIAAETATAGHVYAWRWTSSTHVAVIQRIQVRARTISAFTAAQELQFIIRRAVGYSAPHSGGTPATLTAGNVEKDTTDNVTRLGDSRIATTAALTAGTHTLSAQPWDQDSYAELAAAATVPKGSLYIDLDFSRGQSAPEPMRQNEGFVITNGILMGAAGTVRLVVITDWVEILAANL